MPDEDFGCAGCKEYQSLTRRGFLGSARRAAATVVSTPAWLPRVSLAEEYVGARDTLVVIFLRGAIDGLSAIVPYGDPFYTGGAGGLRPTLWVPPPSSPGGVTDLDGFFGLPDPMLPLMNAYQAGDLLFIQATGSPDPSRSHFDAFKIMEFGTPLQPQTVITGWLGRHLQMTAPLPGNAPLRAAAIGDLVPQMLAGGTKTLPVPDPANFAFPGNPDNSVERAAILQTTYTAATEPLASAALNTLDTISLLESIDFQSVPIENGAVYPNSAFGQAMRSTAALIKADIGVEAATIDKGGWDTHANEGNQGGQMFNLMSDLASGLEAFHLDMLGQMNSMTLLLMSEFGRRADENGSQGTDHGHGSIMMAMGGNVAGGQVLADWTDGQLLHPDLKFNGDSLDVTIDYRDVVSEVLEKRIANPDVASVFPNYTPTFPGVIV